VGSAAIIDWYSFLFFRFAGGLAVGASSVVGPMYIAEISPSRWRGRFVAFFQFNIVLGIVLAYFSNYWIHGIAHDWQWMLGVEAIPAIAFALLLYTVPESPRWLVKQDREAEARHVIKKVSNADIEQEIHEIKESLVTIGAPRIFEMSGVFTESAMMQSIVIGLTNLTFTMIGMILIDQVGRKKLLYIGSTGMTLSLALVAKGFYQDAFSGYYMLICLMGFIAFFAISLGAVIWVLISEVFPNNVRSKGQVLGSMTHWVWSALLSWMFPVFIRTGGTFIFSFFAIMMFLSFFFALRLPETKNKSLEQIQKELTN
jgi:MFS family permease